MADCHPLETEIAHQKPDEPFHRRFLSAASSKSLPISLWASSDFLLGAGVVIIQPSTSRVVLLKRVEKFKDENGVETDGIVYFLPKGRKDVGESLSEAALREGYEESGYKCTLLPLNVPTHAPAPSEVSKDNPEGDLSATHRYPNTEPFYISTYHFDDPGCFDPNHSSGNGVQYFAFWYLAQIGEHAKEEVGTRTAFETGYETLLLPFEEAIELMHSESNRLRNWAQRTVLKMAWRLWEAHLKSTRTAQ